MVKTPVSGLIYTDVKYGEGATSNTLGMKNGEACAQSILGLVGTGDASISTAARSANIKTISYVDEYATSVLGVWGKYCTRVYGN